MIPVENNSWDYVQGLIEKEISSAFKLRIKERYAIYSQTDKVKALRRGYQNIYYAKHIKTRHYESTYPQVQE